MSDSELRAYFANNHPHLSEDELDRCCTNINGFVDIVLELMEYEETPQQRDELPKLPDWTET